MGARSTFILFLPQFVTPVRNSKPAPLLLLVPKQGRLRMLRSDSKPFYLMSPGGHGALMLRARARRMGFVVVMLATIIAAPVVLFVGSAVF
jgi:hypothetical protein